ncbi:hypothetical protein KP509_01G062000 [Ceratopteris richardii]|nr:hypothetical protein KP509_01G062000 [Ceratopteris richardii]
MGKMNECAAYQARLQSNLMYLAAIADSQPQPPPVHAQVNPAAVMPGGLHYMAHQQAQQQMAQQQALMAARNPIQYTQPSLSSMHHSAAAQHHQQHQALAAHHGMSPAGNNGLPGFSSGSSLGGNNTLGPGGFPDFSRSGSSAEDVSRGMGNEIHGNNRLDGGSVLNSMHMAGGGSVGNGHGHGSEEPETSYLKASEEDGN